MAWWHDGKEEDLWMWKWVPLEEVNSTRRQMSTTMNPTPTRIKQINHFPLVLKRTVPVKNTHVKQITESHSVYWLFCTSATNFKIDYCCRHHPHSLTPHTPIIVANEYQSVHLICHLIQTMLWQRCSLINTIKREHFSHFQSCPNCVRWFQSSLDKHRFQHTPWWSTYNAQYETAWGGRASINPNGTTLSKCRIANPSGNAKDYTYHGRKTLKFCTNYRQNLLYGRVLAELSRLWPHEGSRNEVECD